MPPDHSLRLLTWNIQHGGGSLRAPWICLALVEARADIIVLTEFRAARGGQIRAALADHGLKHQALSDAAEGANAVLLASRWPLERAGLAMGAGGAGGGDSAAGRMVQAQIPLLGLEVVGAHIPPPAPGGERARVWRQALLAARSGQAGRLALLGDFNTGRTGPDGSGFRHTALLGQLATLGYVDAWRRLHPAERAMTWRGPAGACARVDHCFLSAGLAGGLRAARIEDFGAASGPGEGRRRLSDHAPVVVEVWLGVDKTRAQAVGNLGREEQKGSKIGSIGADFGG